MQELAKDTSSARMLPVKVIRDESQATLLFDPIRREILRLLSRQALTGKDLSDIIGISAPAMHHHLNALARGQFITVVKREAGIHGIVQKWYRSAAQAFIVDRDRLPDRIRRYFMSMDMERARGVAAASAVWTKGSKLSERGLDSLTRQICTLIARAAQNDKGGLEDDPEKVFLRIYIEALKQLEI